MLRRFSKVKIVELKDWLKGNLRRWVLGIKGWNGEWGKRKEIKVS